jgi:hypothetical protein
MFTTARHVLGYWIEETATDSRKWATFLLGELGGGGGANNSSPQKSTVCYDMFHMTSELAGPCEHCNEPSGSIKGGEFIDYPGDFLTPGGEFCLMRLSG